MGGRGSGSTISGKGGGAGGAGGGTPNPTPVPVPQPQPQPQPTPTPPPGPTDVNTLISQYSHYGSNTLDGHGLHPGMDDGEYDADGNPAYLKWKNQTDEDKAARYLAKVGKPPVQQVDPKWPFYDNPYQKMVLDLGLNAMPYVLSEKDFNKYVRSTGQHVFYRGWSTKSSADRFTQSQYSHTGTGRYGDGYYFTDQRSTAYSYGQGAVTKLALSPKARVITLSDLRIQMSQAGYKFTKALQYAGSTGQRSYGSNDGEAQFALKLGYNVIAVDDWGWGSPGSGNYLCGLTRDAFVVSSKY